MKLVYWMYNGPAHLGTLRTASSFKNVHAIMHAPLGDDYFNVMRSMLERERDFTPVTASIVDRHVLARGSQEKVIQNIVRKDKEEQPDLILLTPTCTSSILQEDLQNFATEAALSSQADILLADVNHYRVNEFQAADRTLEQVIRYYLSKNPSLAEASKQGRQRTQKPSANILGIYTLGFHHQHDCRELKRLLYECGIEVNQILPLGGRVQDISRLPEAWFNIVPYREMGLMSAQFLEKEFDMPYVSIPPIGILDTASFLRSIDQIIQSISGSSSGSSSGPSSQEAVSAQGTPALREGLRTDVPESNLLTNVLQPGFMDSYIERQTKFVSQSAWFSRSIDCQNLTGKRAVVFGDATHAAGITKILAREMGIHVCCAGTYCKQDADWFREQVSEYTDSILITDDHTQVSDMIEQIQPNCLFGTQMERHIGKRLGIPCGVISSPSHIQNFPLGYRPFLAYEGTNQIADLIYNTNQLGMEEHLLEIFGGHDTQESDSESTPTISGAHTEVGVKTGHSEAKSSSSSPPQVKASQEAEGFFEWNEAAQKELSKIPGFVRSKVKKNVQTYAQLKGLTFITPELMYEAKENA